MNKSKSTLYHKIYDAIAKIPAGKVATYKQIAEMAGIAGHARVVGYALYKLPEGNNIPWHRVINSKGKISYAVTRNGHDNLQKALLLEEGIQFSDDETINLECFGYLISD
jgi:methylated-DNA-protein-cysteine methyltransferase-like protein